jgi:hypothetical protein
MLPSEKGSGKFYQLFKVHKKHTKAQFIISGYGLKISANLFTTIQNI